LRGTRIEFEEMFYWIYDLPTWSVAVLFALVFVAFSWFGAIFVRPVLKLLLRNQPGLNDGVGYILSFFSVVYGLLLGMLAIATYQALSDAEKTVVNETAALTSLYRGVSSYPEPSRSELQNMLGEYTRYVIEEAWPLQRKGIIPPGGSDRVTAFQVKLLAFEPQTKGQEALHAEVLRQFDTLVSARRLRLYSVQSGLPAIMWYTIAASSLVGLILVWMLDLRLMAHLLLGGLLSFVMALMIGLIALMDNPYRGELSVSPQAFQLVYDRHMKK
jgi:hypothetical protein